MHVVLCPKCFEKISDGDHQVLIKAVYVIPITQHFIVVTDIRGSFDLAFSSRRLLFASLVLSVTLATRDGKLF